MSPFIAYPGAAILGGAGLLMMLKLGGVFAAVGVVMLLGAAGVGLVTLAQSDDQSGRRPSRYP